MKRVISLLCVCVLLFGIVGCSNSELIKNVSTKEVTNQKDSKKSDKELSPIGLTEQQKIEDYNFYWDTMNELYPYWGELKDKGIDKDAIYKKYLKLVKSSKNDCEFLNLIFKCVNDELGKFHYGHLNFKGPEGYSYSLEIYENVPNYEAWRNVLNNPVSKNNYKLFKFNNKHGFQPNDVKEKESSSELVSPINSSIKFSTDIMNDGKTGYICIPSFDGLLIEKEVPQVQKFINDNNKLSDIIIDIRGNGGGNDSYWQDGIVSPNIAEMKTYSMYYLYNYNLFKNELSKPFMTVKNAKSSSIKDLPKFDNLSKYVNNFRLYTYNTQQISENTSKKPYKGKIWVLGDCRNGSASSGFLDFCKQNKFATIVGGSSGGNNPNGDPSIFASPNSGFILRFDLFYGLNEDGSCNAVSGTKPDIECNSKDALDVCIKKINAK